MYIMASSNEMNAGLARTGFRDLMTYFSTGADPKSAGPVRHSVEENMLYFVGAGSYTTNAGKHPGVLGEAKDSMIYAAIGGRANSPENSGLLDLYPAGDAPVLVGYPYMSKAMIGYLQETPFKNWVLDSGAFTAAKGGKPIEIEKYIEDRRGYMKMKHPPKTIFALDVIGDPDASIRNTERMWADGVEAVPCFHYREPVRYLDHLAKSYPRIAFGGLVGVRPKERVAWGSSCLRRIWPKRVHGFGVTDRQTRMACPFDTVDSSSWVMGPRAFGRSSKFPGVKFPTGKANSPAVRQLIAAEVLSLLKIDLAAERKWTKQLAEVRGSGWPA